MKEIIKKELVERVIVEGPMDNRSRLLQELWDQGYEVRIVGPKPMDETRVDLSTVHIVAEKVIEDEWVQ